MNYRFIGEIFMLALLVSQSKSDSEGEKVFNSTEVRESTLESYNKTAVNNSDLVGNFTRDNSSSRSITSPGYYDRFLKSLGRLKSRQNCTGLKCKRRRDGMDSYVAAAGGWGWSPPSEPSGWGWSPSPGWGWGDSEKDDLGGLEELLGLIGLLGLKGLKGLKPLIALLLPLLPILLPLLAAPLLLPLVGIFLSAIIKLALILFIPVPIIATGRS